MNRNSESHYSRIPQVDHERSSFDRSFSHTLSGNFGDLIPIYCEEVLPGDTLTMSTSKIIRLQTPLAPVYTNMYADTFYFFVPNRLVWDKWKEFMGENTSSAWAPQVEYTVPAIIAPGSSGFAKGTNADYLGYPIGVGWSGTDVNAPMVLPLRALALIWNEFFRDQNLQDPVNVSVSSSNLGGDNNDPYKGGYPFKVNKYHDRFTSCLPQPQKGPQVNILGNLQGQMPVVAGIGHSVPNHNYGSYTKIVPVSYATNNNAGSGTPIEPFGFMDKTGALTESWKMYSSSGGYPDPGANSNPITIANLWANASSSDSTVSGLSVSINDLRLSVVTQAYYEALARSGSRYEEQIAQFFGVTNPDARVQHPEYLGGNRVQLNVHEVTNTAQSEQDFLGDVGGRSVTSDSHSDFQHSFTEHGWVIGVVACRYDHVYSQGCPKKFLRRDKFSFYNPVFSHIGEQPVYDVELYAKGKMNDKSVFGYNEAWCEYRTAENRVSAEMRPDGTGNLAHWTAADLYAASPVLSSGWIAEDKTPIDRTLAVTSSLAHQLFMDFYFNCKWSRCMPMYSVPGNFGMF